MLAQFLRLRDGYGDLRMRNVLATDYFARLLSIQSIGIPSNTEHIRDSRHAVAWECFVRLAM